MALMQSMNQRKTLSSNYFRRHDERDDSEFYSSPRLVVHIDDAAIDALIILFEKLLPETGMFLDLMSGWRSHLPQSAPAVKVIGLGMNAQEMVENPQLDAYIVHDLNKCPSLPFINAGFDAAICTVSVQYLTRPIEVFREVNRTLKPGGIFLISFSNRYFPTKAVAAWLATTDEQHLKLVDYYFSASANWRDLQMQANTPENGDPLYAVWAHKK